WPRSSQWIRHAAGHPPPCCARACRPDSGTTPDTNTTRSPGWRASATLRPRQNLQTKADSKIAFSWDGSQSPWLWDARYACCLFVHLPAGVTVIGAQLSFSDQAHVHGTLQMLQHRYAIAHFVFADEADALEPRRSALDHLASFLKWHPRGRSEE